MYLFLNTILISSYFSTSTTSLDSLIRSYSCKYIASQKTGLHSVSALVSPIFPHLQHRTLIWTNCRFKSTKSKKLSISSLSSHSCSHVFSVMELYSEIGGYWSHSLVQYGFSLEKDSFIKKLVSEKDSLIKKLVLSWLMPTNKKLKQKKTIYTCVRMREIRSDSHE